MPDGYNTHLAIENLFGDSVLRISAMETIAEAKAQKLLPLDHRVDISSIHKTSLTPLLGVASAEFSTSYQPEEFAPIVTVGIQVVEKTRRPFVSLTHSVWLADEAILSLSCIRALSVAAIQSSQQGFLFHAQCEQTSGDVAFHFLFDTMTNPDNFKIVVYEPTPLGVYENIQLFNAHTPLPDVRNWPQACLPLGTVRLLDPERIGNIIIQWPKTLTNQWHDLDPKQALRELNSLIISTSGV